MKLENKWLRETYVDQLIKAAKENEDICIVEADLMKAAGTTRFGEVFPERTINVGVAEQNMIGVASGMASMGKIPFTHTFTAFATRRVLDQVALSVAYAGLNVKMMGSDPGITAELNGGTHMSMEDVAIIRTIPNMVIYEPVDSNQLIDMFPQIVKHPSFIYTRLLRRNAVEVFSADTKFQLGKGHMIKEGKDITILATGIMVAEAIKATKILSEKGIDAELINIHTIKPLDQDMILKSVAKTGCVVTAENHSIIGGLGGAVAELLVENLPVPMERIGVKDHFGEVGLTTFLMEKYNMTAKDIFNAASNVINRK